MLRRTKIIATLGPASETKEVLQEMIANGVNIVRINMSHADHEYHARVIKIVRQIAAKEKIEIAILVDLQGPKIRVSNFKEGKIKLERGEQFILDANLPDGDGNKLSVGIDYKNLPNDLSSGDRLLLDDGRIVMDVDKIDNNRIFCTVQIGGILSSRKGLNRQGGGLSAEPLTEKDKKDIIFAAEHQADYVAVSFPREASDITTARKLLLQANSEAGVIAKIERVEAVENIEEIIEAADAVMVARGDLGVELGFAQLPAVQKKIIKIAKREYKSVITATQMMESMIFNPIPTRAEVSDVANAVIEGTDAVMLSAETATGNYPTVAVKDMAEICIAAEQQFDPAVYDAVSDKFLINSIERAIAMAAMFTANHMQVKAIVALTQSGSTPLQMSRLSTDIPIYGVSSKKSSRGKMCLYRGVYPIDFDATPDVLEALKQRNTLTSGDIVIITKGDANSKNSKANTLQIITIN